MADRTPSVISALSESDKTFLGVVIVALLAPTWLSWWNARIAKKQVTPNGGSSLKDQVTKLGTQITSIYNKMDTVVATQELHTVEIATMKAVQHAVQQTITQIQEGQNHEQDHHDVPPAAA